MVKQRKWDLVWNQKWSWVSHCCWRSLLFFCSSAEQGLSISEGYWQYTRSFLKCHSICIHLVKGFQFEFTFKLIKIRDNPAFAVVCSKDFNSVADLIWVNQPSPTHPLQQPLHSGFPIQLLELACPFVSPNKISPASPSNSPVNF